MSMLFGSGQATQQQLQLQYVDPGQGGWAPSNSVNGPVPAQQLSHSFTSGCAGHVLAMHGPVVSAPNFACIQGMLPCVGQATYMQPSSYRGGAASQPGSAAGTGNNVYLQLQQLPQAPTVSTAGCAPGSPALSYAGSTAGVGPPGAPGDQQLLLLELQAALSTQPDSSTCMAGVQALLAGAGAANSAQGKLQLLEQLQMLIAQQQQQLQQQQLQQQLENQNQQQTIASNQPGSFNLMQVGAPSGADTVGGTAAVGVCLSAPGCVSSADGSDTRLGRDQRVRASFSGYMDPAGSVRSSALLQVPLQQQPQVQFQQQMMHQDIMSPCAFTNTPTALAALPPSLLAEVVGLDAGGSLMTQAAVSKAHSVSGGSGSGPNWSGTTPTGADAAAAAAAFGYGAGVANRLVRPSGAGCAPPPAGFTSTGVTDTSVAALQQQLHQAIHQLTGMQICGNNTAAGSSGTLSVPLSSGAGSKAWDWASVGELLRTDSSASRASSCINRTSSGMASGEALFGNTIWGDAGVHAGGMLPASALAMPACTSGGVLMTQLQRATSSVSCASIASAGGAPGHRNAGAAASLGPRSSGSGAGVGSTAAAPAAERTAPTVACGADGRVMTACGEGGHTSGSGQCNKQGAASVDSLLRNCAPKWAKAGWNPKASVAPSLTAKGTGAFMRVSQPSSSDAPPEPKPAAHASKGTGAFLPPAIRAAAVAAAAGLSTQSQTAKCGRP